MNKNGRLKLFMAAKISLHGNWVMRFFTILILSFCFTAFGLISVFYTGNYRETYVNAVLNSAEEYTGFCFRDSYNLYEQSEYSVLGQELIDYIKKETGREYVYTLPRAYLNTERYIANHLGGAISVDGRNNDVMYADSEAAYESLGFKVLAGRYPENAYEVAVNEKCFEYFQLNDYCDRSEGFYYDKHGDWQFDYSLEIKQKIESINDYGDLIGKTIMCEGDIEEGVLCEGGFYFVKIVGIIDTHFDESYEKMSAYKLWPTIDASIFVSKEWINTFSSGGDYLSFRMYTQKATTYAEAKEFIDVVDSAREFVDTLIAEKQAEAKALNATSEGVGLVETLNFNNLWQNDSGGLLLFVPIGIVFGIFSIVLVIFLTSATLNNQRRQIGVLRALGLGKGGVRRVAWSGIGFVSIISFALSILATFLLYRLWMFPVCSPTWFGVSFVFFNIWNVLLLAALAFIVPLIASVPSLVRFSKRSVAEILTDRAKTKKRRKNR